MLDLHAMTLTALFESLTADRSLRRLVDAAFQEDLGDAGDVTTASIVPTGRRAVAALRTRQAGVAAGLETIPAILGERPVAVSFRRKDGQPFRAGETLATLEGELASILAIERTLLNIVGRLSGVATLTNRYVRAVAGTRAVICETRKTTPGMRNLEKYAVRCGGGTLHRLGLFDAALYKDNHLAGIPIKELAARLREAIEKARREHDLRFVEVEVDSIEQLKEILKLGSLVDIALLDNMRPSMLREAVKLRGAKAKGMLLEASGGVNLDTVRAIAETGVDRISAGALTHSAACLDVGLDIDA